MCRSSLVLLLVFTKEVVKHKGDGHIISLQSFESTRSVGLDWPQVLLNSLLWQLDIQGFGTVMV